MSKSFIYIANWKMHKSYHEAITWCLQYKDELVQLSTRNTVAICPQFTDIVELTNIFKNTALKIGAQNCAAYESGSYTGEVSAVSLAQSGCSYCIVGHSERRIYFHETDDTIMQKVFILLKNTLIPILCIGETAQEKEQGLTFKVLEKQLYGLRSPSWNLLPTLPTIIIAYEPVWAIGSGIIPDHNKLETVLLWIADYVSSIHPCSFKILYGGSVNGNTSATLKKLAHLDGFLIGGASLDFQELKKIVL
ncbi:MAG: triose-phosphate isomerase [Candidatus Babeliaceae bacterium]